MLVDTRVSFLECKRAKFRRNYNGGFGFSLRSGFSCEHDVLGCLPLSLATIASPRRSTQPKLKTYKY